MTKIILCTICLKSFTKNPRIRTAAKNERVNTIGAIVMTYFSAVQHKIQQCLGFYFLYFVFSSSGYTIKRMHCIYGKCRWKQI